MVFAIVASLFAIALTLVPQLAFADDALVEQGFDCVQVASEQVEASGEEPDGLVALGGSEDPTDPSETEEPYSKDSEETEEPMDSDEPVEPDDPENPEDPENPDDPENPEDPEEPEDPEDSLESEYDPVVSIATGDGFEVVRKQQLDGLDYIVLPSYAGISALSISWAEAYLDQLVYASDEEAGTYSNSPFDATSCSVDDAGARLVWVRATEDGVTHLLRVLQSGGVRTLYLKSDNPIDEGRAYVESSADHTAKATGSMTLVTSSGEVVVQDAALTQIKGRGNSTWYADKKPYQIKLDKKASLLDGSSANKAKTWVLLANAYDDSQLRNYVALKTAIAAGLTATPDCEFVDLYYDGEYRGLYLLAEKVQVANGRVEIDEIENESSTETALEELPTAIGRNSYGNLFQYVKGAVNAASPDAAGGYLIEIDNASYSKERCYFYTSAGYFVLKTPEDATYDQVKYISEYVQAAIDAASEADGDAAQYFDLDSLARYFLVNEMAKNSDYMRYSSTFFYKGSGSDVLHAGPVWDFDLAFGVHMYEGYAEYIDVTGITDANATFFVRNRQFASAVESVLSDGFLLQAKAWLGTGASSIAGICASAAASRVADELMWGYYDPDTVVVVKYGTYAESAAYLSDWLDRRIAWMERELSSSLEALCAQPSYEPGSEANVERLSGDIALDTMSAIVDAGEFKSKFAILVTSDGYWDALTASGVAGLVDAPVIMTPTTYLAEQARAQLAELRPSTIIVCGGTAAVTSEVATAAAAAAGGAKIERCWGQDAVGTAINIYSRAVALTGGQWATTAFLCTNDGYWDALSAAPISYAMHMPIFLTDGAKSISIQTLAALKAGGIKAVYIVGGTVAISSAVEAAIKKAGIVISSRLAGATAVETSEAVATYGINRGMSANLMGVATTDGYWDALSGSAFCGKMKSVIVLVSGSKCHSVSVSGFLFLNNARVRQAYVFGGVAAIAQQTFEAVRLRLSGSVQ